MSNTKGKAGKVFLMLFIWLAIAAGVVAFYKYFWVPWDESELEEQTSSSSQYDYVFVVPQDAFSGYAVWRSPVFADFLAKHSIKLIPEDDGADYVGRMSKLASGTYKLGLMPINSMITTGMEIGVDPVSIVHLIDVTVGADAAVAYPEGLQTLDDLNHQDGKIIVVKDSPGEYLARVIKATFGFPRMGSDWLVRMNSIEDVFRTFKGAKRTDKTLYPMWEPLVSDAKDNGALVLLSSEKIPDHIVDALVVERRFLADQENQKIVRLIVESYLRTVYYYSENPEELKQLIVDDAKRFKQKLTARHVEALVKGIRWKNTLENYAHFGLLPRNEQGNLKLMDDIITDIVNVLNETDAFGPGKRYTTPPNKLYFDGILRDLKADDFHPGKSINLLDGMGPNLSDTEDVRSVGELSSLSAQQWKALRPVGHVSLEPLSFTRASSQLQARSKNYLRNVARRLQQFPSYYVLVTGHVAAEQGDDMQGNRNLAAARARTVVDYLVSQGINNDRMRAQYAEPNIHSGQQAVSFKFYEK